jgi:outer membrane protein assembly factor BamB
VQPGNVLVPALEIAVIILLILASIAGMWVAGNQDDDRVRLAVPVATPTPEAAPGWTHWRGDATRSGTTNFGPINQPVELWRYQAYGPCGPYPAVAGDSVYVACEDGTLHAFARATGELRWSFTAEPFELFVNGLTIAGGLAYVMGEFSMSLYAVDIATGEERWRYDAASVAAAPAVAGGMALVNTAEGFLIGLDAATGEERWRTTIPTGGMVGDAALLDGMAYVGSETGNLAAVDAATGEIVWQVDTGDHRNASAVVADGIVYVGAGSLDGSLSAYDAETGALRWQRDEPMLTPSVANGVGYSGSVDGTVYAFDTASGEELWRVQVGEYANPIAIASDIIYVPSEGDRAVYALDAATGDELWHITVDGEPTYQAAVVDGAIYVATSFGVIQAFAEPAPGSATPAPGIASPEASPATPEAAIATPVSSPVATP